MARLSDNRIAWTYHSDDGNDYRVAAVKAYTDQAKQGGADGSALTATKPRGMKMRRITVRNVAGGVDRVIPVYTTDAAILVLGATINLNLGADSASFVSGGHPIPEDNGRKSSVTTQST